MVMVDISFDRFVYKPSVAGFMVDSVLPVLSSATTREKYCVIRISLDLALGNQSSRDTDREVQRVRSLVTSLASDPRTREARH